MKMNNKGQTGGLITALVFGVASLVIGVIIAFVIVSTLSSANLLTGGRITYTTTNESDSSGPIAFLNQTGYYLNASTGPDYVNGSFTITAVWGDGNQSGGSQANISNTPTGYTTLISAGNYSVNGSGFVRNATSYNFPNVSITYTYTQKSTEELATTRLQGNFSSGVDNVSAKLPTVLLVSAVVLILAVLAILVGVWQRMRMGGGSGL